MNKSVCLSVTLSGHVIVDRFSLTLPETGCLCLFGPSGCGENDAPAGAGGVITGTVRAGKPVAGEKDSYFIPGGPAFSVDDCKGKHPVCTEKTGTGVIAAG